MKEVSLGKEIESILNELAEVKLGIKKPNGKSPVDACNDLVSKLDTSLKAACEKNIRMDISIVGKFRCSICKKEVKTEMLHCGHFICKDCVHNLIKTISDGKFNNLIWEIVCPKCKLQITGKTITAFFSLEYIANENYKATSIRAAKECCLCMSSVYVDESVSLCNCAHAFHDKCFKDFLAEKINAGKISVKDLCCPMKDCNDPIPPPILQLHLTLELLEKFTKYKLKFEYTSDVEIYKTCPLCDVGMFLLKTEEIFKCLNKECQRYNKETCCKCDAMPHHTGKTCEEFLQSQQNEKNAADFKKVQLQNGFRDCPKCGMFFQKTKGCNCMTCGNPQCKSANGTICFCYLCGVLIKSHADAEHFSNDPNTYFGKTCITLGNKPEVKKEEVKKREAKKREVKKQ